MKPSSRPSSRSSSRRPDRPQNSPTGSSHRAGNAHHRKVSEPQSSDTSTWLITCTQGLESFVLNEMETRFASEDGQGLRPAGVKGGAGGEIAFSAMLPVKALQRHTAHLRLADAAYSVQRHAIPRPLALLGDQSWRKFSGQIEAVLQSYPAKAFKTFALAAAGRDSSVMQRIRAQIAAQFGLADGDTQGDLHIRIRPVASVREADEKEGGWETLVRLQPRPLATRSWRVCDYPGALSGPVAAAMLSLLPGAPVLVNLCCGSGTLLAEAQQQQFTAAFGVDNSTAALECARANLRLDDRRHAHPPTFAASLLLGDVGALPIRSGEIQAITADLPFGNLSGTHQANRVLYPALLAEAGRIAAPDARFVLITHEIRLLSDVIAAQRAWRSVSEYPINLRGLHPRIYVLERT